MSALASGSLSKDAMDVLIIERRLLEYAASNWGYHYLEGPRGDLKCEVLTFLHRKSHASLATQVLARKNISIGYAKDLTELHMVAYFAIPDIAEEVLMEGVAVNDRDSQGKTALMWAAILKHSDHDQTPCTRGHRYQCARQ